MKKVLLMMLCSTIFFVGCNKAAQVPAAENQDITTNVAVSTDTVAVSTDVAVAQGDVK